MSGELLTLTGETLLRLAISYSIAVYWRSARNSDGARAARALAARPRRVDWLARAQDRLPADLSFSGSVLFDAPKIVMSIVACIFPLDRWHLGRNAGRRQIPDLVGREPRRLAARAAAGT